MQKVETPRHYWIDASAEKLGVKFQVAEIKGVTVKKKNEELKKSKQATVTKLLSSDITMHPILQGYRDLFTSIGVSDVLSSPEWLFQFALRNHKLPDINTVVDAYNEKSLEKFVVASAHDLAKISGDVHIQMTTGDEIFYPLGSGTGERLEKGEWAGFDDSHILCRLNTKQSELSKVTFDTTDLLIYVQGNRLTDEVYLNNTLIEICENIIKYNSGNYYLLNRKV